MERPFFVVGCPRSGTTLLKHMLDAHPRLAVPYESHFLVAQAPRRSLRRRPEATVETILAHPAVRRWSVDPDAVRAQVAAIAPSDFASLARAVFEAYARAQSKPRWGDKTPGYVTHLPLLDRIFPDALFVHVIRDGREVAVSLAERPWGPRSAIAGAFWWRTKTGAGVRDGRPLPPSRYLEVRHEDLVATPEAALRRICRFLGEEYWPSMHEYGAGVALAEEPGDPAGTAHLSKPPTAGLRDWKAGRSERETAAIESVCAPLLDRLGYGPAPRRAAALAFAWAVRLRDLPGRVPVEARLRLRPTMRRV